MCYWRLRGPSWSAEIEVKLSPECRRRSLVFVCLLIRSLILIHLNKQRRLQMT